MELRLIKELSTAIEKLNKELWRIMKYINNQLGSKRVNEVANKLNNENVIIELRRVYRKENDGSSWSFYRLYQNDCHNFIWLFRESFV